MQMEFKNSISWSILVAADPFVFAPVSASEFGKLLQLSIVQWSEKKKTRFIAVSELGSPHLISSLYRQNLYLLHREN
jgi:hypothetical protein